MTDTPLRIAALMAQSLPDPGSKRWEAEMRKVITRGHTAAWLAGTADRLGVHLDSPLLSRQRLSRAERKDIAALVDKQLDYLRRFDRQRGDMSEAAVAARSNLYPGAVRSTYYSARYGDWDIPDDIMPGMQQCITNCKCSIRIDDHGDGTGTLIRRMHGPEAGHCEECPPLQGNHPIVRKDITTKHLSGKHNQATHGRRSARRRAYASEYRTARNNGASVTEARSLAKAAGLAKQQERDDRLDRMRKRHGDVAAVGFDRQPEPPKKSLDESVRETEDQIRGQRHETMYVYDKDGNVKLRRDGGKNTVEVKDTDRPLFKDAVLTHNHPTGWEFTASDPRRKGNSFSPEDIQTAVWGDMAEIRAVTPSGRYSMRRPKNGWPPMLMGEHRRVNSKIRQEFYQRIAEGRMTPEQAEANHHHEVWSRVTKQLGIPYDYTED